MTDMWHNVTVYGPAAEIDRFKRLCIDPAESVFTAGQFGWDGCDCTISVPSTGEEACDPADGSGAVAYVHNLQQFFATTLYEYSFSFDTDGWFPDYLFEDLAAHFPKLAFDCTCIEALDECMGFGWFNVPLGGEAFRQDYPVPKNYWTGGGGRKRSIAAEAAHGARIEALLDAARRVDAGRSSA